MRKLPLVLLGALLILLPAFEEAAAQGQQQRRNQPAPQTGPASLSGRYLAARVAEQGHDYDTAADQLDLALAQLPSDRDLQYAAFRLRMYAGRFEQAAQLAAQVAQHKPGDALANLVLAIQLIKKADYARAEQQLARIGSENQLGPLNDYVLAWLKAGQKDFAAARTHLAKLKPAAGERAEAPALTIEAQIDELAGDRATAEAKYRKALELDKGGLRTTVFAAEGLRRLGKVDEARTILRTYGEKFSDTVIMDALVAPNAPAPKPPSPASGIAEILFDIGGIFGSDPRSNRGDLALIFQLLAVELRPDHDFAWLMISGLQEQFQRPQKAIAALAKIGPTSPLFWQARLRTAALDAQEEKIDQAVTRLRALVAEKPERIDAALTLADLLRGKERWNDAIAAYNTAISRLKNVEERHWPIYFGRGIALERSKRWPDAEKDMKKALELSPEQPYVLNYLGYSWIDQGLHLEEGMKMLKRATELRPDDGAISDSVGWAYYRLGKYPEAVEWLEKAIEQKGDDATIVEHLGDAYWHVGRQREARFQWERALNQKPDKDRIPIIKDKLEKGLNPGNDKPTVYEKKGG
ncbi:MAG TPA: tetratricopeptide repeat protein [Reyranellaceae bacterium]|nr:tetratricopeptide repeat protein [Reyranellaceae bacterium]